MIASKLSLIMVNRQSLERVVVVVFLCGKSTPGKTSFVQLLSARNLSKVNQKNLQRLQE